MNKRDINRLQKIAESRTFWTPEGIIESIPHLVEAKSLQGLMACELLIIHGDSHIICNSRLDCWHGHTFDAINSTALLSIVNSVLSMKLDITIEHSSFYHQIELSLGWWPREEKPLPWEQP